MRLTLRDNLPFAQVTVKHRGAELTISDVLIDTGSATTILAADQVWEESSVIGWIQEEGSLHIVGATQTHLDDPLNE